MLKDFSLGKFIMKRYNCKERGCSHYEGFGMQHIIGAINAVE